MSDAAPTRARHKEQDSALWRRTKLVAGEALELPDGKRAAFIEAACAGDNALLAEVRALVEASLTNPGALTEHGVPASALLDALDVASMGEGTTIGRYTVLRRLGSGGMGVVFEAFDPALRRKVALKLLSTGLASTGARRRFEGEAAALARLDHRAIARVYEAGVQHHAGQALSVPYFAMEFVEGARTLDVYVREQRPELRTLVALFARVCDAVQHGHQKGVLHRDLKPGNILIDSNNDPKVIDFGVSRLLDPGGTMHATMSGDIVGTPAYLPPEAFERGAHALDTRADVYSLGVVMHEILGGRNLYGEPGLTPVQVGRLVCTRALPMLGTLREDCKGDLEVIVAKATAREADDRYQSVEQLGADLRRVLDDEPILARPAPMLRRAGHFARRNKPLVAGVAAIGLALTVGVAGLTIGLTQARASERRAREQAARAQRTADFFLQMVRSANPFSGEAFRNPVSLDPALRGEPTSPPWPSAARPDTAPGVGDLLALASERVEESFPDDPRLQAELASMLAHVSSSIADPRHRRLIARAEQLLSRAYGPDDYRTMIARNSSYYGYVINSEHAILPSIERDLDIVRARARPEERDLLTALWGHIITIHGQRSRYDRAIELLESIRPDLDRMSPGDDRYKVTLDLSLLRLRTLEHQPIEGLNNIGALLDRAKALGDSGQDLVLTALFDWQLYAHSTGDYDMAMAIQGEGAARSADMRGGLDNATYEWWSNMYFTAITCNNLDVAEYAARMQSHATNTMLGPRSSYTTKANGRLARVLLTQRKNLDEAERVARLAVDGAAEVLSDGEGWAVFHETLWAWAVRMKGDPVRAREILRYRMEEGWRTSRHVWPAWLQLLQWTEVAQCEMDLGLRSGDLDGRSDRIEHALAEAECYAEYLPRNWPSIRLARAARERYSTLLAQREQR